MMCPDCAPGGKVMSTGAFDRVVEPQLGSQGELLGEVTLSAEIWRMCRSQPGKEQKEGGER